MKVPWKQECKKFWSADINQVRFIVSNDVDKIWILNIRFTLYPCVWLNNILFDTAQDAMDAANRFCEDIVNGTKDTKQGSQKVLGVNHD